ncbi:MAG: CRISPR-associated endonuclease Cas2 [Candidatus Hydrogenedentes bacterium]|nr:CRISPR-associated endonuclease Cas2 [Candidatus Hydrogenedentota bacterium]
MQAHIQKELDPNQDSVRYYPLCADCRALALNRGGAEITPPKPYRIV